MFVSLFFFSFIQWDVSVNFEPQPEKPTTAFDTIIMNHEENGKGQGGETNVKTMHVHRGCCCCSHTTDQHRKPFCNDYDGGGFGNQDTRISTVCEKSIK